MPAAASKHLAKLFPMSDVGDIAKWCAQRGHEKVVMRTQRPNLLNALEEVGIRSVNEPSNLVLWLDDEINEGEPWSFASPDADVVIEASLPTYRGVHALAVETDRAVILTSDGDSYRRIEFIEGSTRFKNIVPVPHEALTQSAEQAGFKLVDRWIDWSMEEPTPGDPCHLSLFRNLK